MAKISKVEAYLNKIYGKEPKDSLRDDFKKVCLDLLRMNIKFARDGIMPKEEAMEEIKKLEEVYNKL